MDVAISTFRAELSTWIQRVHDGEEVVVTDRGAPVVRLLPIGAAPMLERLTAQGVLSPPSAARPSARGRTRVASSGSVSDLVGDQRR